MSIELFLYLADVIPKIAVMAGIMGTTLCISSIFIGLAVAESVSDSAGLKTVVAMVCGGLFFVLVAVLTPSKQTIYMMAGANVAKQALNSSIGQKVQQAIEDQLDEFIKKGAKK